MLEPLKTEEDYKKAIKQLELLFDAAPNTADGKIAEILTFLIENYEYDSMSTSNLSNTTHARQHFR